MNERAVVMGDGSVLLAGHLPEYITKVPTRNPGVTGKPLENAEKQHIEDILVKVGWNKSKAARQLQISRNRLDRKIEKFGIKYPQEI